MGTYSRNVSITDQVLILDGLTGTGKTMFGPILGCLNGVQPGRFEYMVEYLSIVAASGHLEPEAAQSLIRTLIDVKTYDNSISRDVNFRPKDLSSVFKHGDRVKILFQLMQKDGTIAIKKLTDNPKMPFFITHQLYGCLDLLSKTYGDGLSVIEMVRHPFYLFDHWLSYLPYYGTSPHDFTLLLNIEGSEFPWFTHRFSEEYIDAKNEDRVALAIAHLMQPILGDLPNSSVSKQMLVIPFEQFVLSPHSFITKIEQHTGRKFSKRINKVLTKQHVPRKSVLAGPNLNIYRRYGFDPKTSSTKDKDSFQALKSRVLPLLSDQVRAKFIDAAERYEAKYGIWF